MADDYQQEIYRMRMQRKQEEAAAHYETLRQDYNQALENRENAALQMVNDNDPSEWNYWDRQMEDAERQLAPYFQAQQPRQDPRAAEWIKRNSAFFERYGQRGINAVKDAHAYLLRPRTDSNNPAYTGCGFHPSHAYTPEYFKKLEDILEMHSEMYHGIKYDPGEKSLTPNEAANISGLSPDQYNAASRAAAAAGKYNK